MTQEQFAAAEARGAQKERAAIVAWLLAQAEARPKGDCCRIFTRTNANAISRGDHLRAEPKGETNDRHS